MKKGSNPSTMFEIQAVIEDTYRGNVDESERIAVILAAPTDEYQSVLKSKKARGHSISLMNLELVLVQYYRKFTKQKD
jgi:hypothetical protein